MVMLGARDHGDCGFISIDEILYLNESETIYFQGTRAEYFRGAECNRSYETAVANVHEHQHSELWFIAAYGLPQHNYGGCTIMLNDEGPCFHIDYLIVESSFYMHSPYQSG